MLPKGVEELVTGQRLEYDYADGRPGPQALRIKVLDEGPRGARHRRGGAGGGAGARRQAKKHSPSDLNGMISDMISMLESTVQRDLRAGRYPERKDGHQMAEVLRAVARSWTRKSVEDVKNARSRRWITSVSGRFAVLYDGSLTIDQVIP